MPRPPRAQIFYSKSFNLVRELLTRLEAGKFSSQIARDLDKSPQLIGYYTGKLHHHNLIKPRDMGAYTEWSLTPAGKEYLKELTFKTFSLRERKVLNPPRARLHDLKVKFRVLDDKGRICWGLNKPLSPNWKRYYLKGLPLDCTLERRVGKKTFIVAHFKELETDKPLFLSEFSAYVTRASFSLYTYLLKEGVTIDPGSAEVVNQHIANETPELNEAVDNHSRHEVNLSRKALSFFPSQLQAKAYYDRSRGPLDIETNDMLYEDKLLLMPETLHDLKTEISPVLREFSDNLTLHLGVLRNLEGAVQDLRANLRPPPLEAPISLEYPRVIDKQKRRKWGYG